MVVPSHMSEGRLDAYSKWSPDERRTYLRWQQRSFEHMLDTRDAILAPELAFHATKMQPAPEISVESREKEDIGESNPVADLVLETLEQAPALRYKGWKRVQDTLSTIPPARKTSELVNLLCSALQGEMVYWQWLQEIEQSISVESLRSLYMMNVILPVSVLTGLEVKSEEILLPVSLAYPEIEEDYLALDDIHVKLYKLKTVDPDDQVAQMEVQKFRQVLCRLMARVRPGKLFAAMTGHLTQLVRDAAPDDNFDFADPHQVLTDCALYL
ncbi:hypothetical protein ACHAO4_009966 [Trichoderma viride]